MFCIVCDWSECEPAPPPGEKGPRMSYDPDFYNQVEGFENIVLSEEEEAALDRAWLALDAEREAEEKNAAASVQPARRRVSPGSSS